VSSASSLAQDLLGGRYTFKWLKPEVLVGLTVAGVDQLLRSASGTGTDFARVIGVSIRCDH